MARLIRATRRLFHDTRCSGVEFCAFGL